ncbi:MAG: YjjG family noncanonical pyrimidine nucleotidase [Faecalibacterium sp.]
MAHYYCVLFDLDNTLLDFDMAEQKALAQTLVDSGIEASHQNMECYRELNEGLWKQLEKGQIRRDKISTERFVRFLKQNNLQGDSIAMSHAYHDNLAMQGCTMPDAADVLRELSEVATIAIASNGFEKVQMSRLAASGLEPYIEASFISEKLGVDKPNSKFFDIALNELGIEQRVNVLMVGDRLASDIKGGENARIATCWYNPEGSENKTNVTPTHEISQLTDLYKIVMEADELEKIGIKNRKHSI